MATLLKIEWPSGEAINSLYQPLDEPGRGIADFPVIQKNGPFLRIDVLDLVFVDDEGFVAAVEIRMQALVIFQPSVEFNMFIF